MPCCSKVLHQQRRRQTAVHLDLVVAARAALRQHLPGEVAGQKGDLPPRQLREMLAQQQGKAVRLLPGGAGGTPDVQAALVLAAPNQSGITDLRRASNGEWSRKNEVSVVTIASTTFACRLPGAGIAPGDQLADRVQIQLAHERRQPGLDEVLLAGLRTIRRSRSSLRMKSKSWSVMEPHRQTCARRRVRSRPVAALINRRCALSPTRCTISSPIIASGSTRSASPARAT